jgi:hypothetical protein
MVSRLPIFGNAEHPGTIYSNCGIMNLENPRFMIFSKKNNAPYFLTYIYFWTIFFVKFPTNFGKLLSIKSGPSSI